MNVASQVIDLRERKKVATRAALRRAALDLVLVHGPEGATVDEIAAAAGVSRRTFFNYFATRDQALAAIDPASVEELLAELDQIDAHEPLGEALQRCFQQWASRLVVDDEVLRMRREATSRWPELAAQGVQDNAALMADMIATLQARRSEDRFELALMVNLMSAVVKAAIADLLRGGSASLADNLSRGFAMLRTVESQFSPPDR